MDITPNDIPLFDTPINGEYRMSNAQQVMRQDIEEGAKRMMQERVTGEPVSLSAVFDETFGTRPTPDLAADVEVESRIPELALSAINTHPDDLVLNLRQWQVVQEMVEAGIRVGLALRR